MAKPHLTARKCVFCGSPKDITREHVLPNWLRNTIPRVSESHSASGFLLHPVAAPGNPIVIQPHLRTHKKPLGTRKLFMVCGDCNTGWMKRVQDELIPILNPLMLGHWDDLTEYKAQRIALWAAMTAAVIAMSFKHTLGVTKADRRFLRSHQAVPENWAIWVGRGSGFSEPIYSNRVATLQSSKHGIDGREPNAAVTTIAIGQLIIHCINVPLQRLMPDPVLYGREFGIFPIHPWRPSDLDWRWIPIIASESPEWDRLLDDFAYKVLFSHRA